MSEMVERAATALHASLGYEQWRTPECTQCVDAVRAVIEAMRRPTEAMCRAALDTGAVQNDEFYITEDDMRTLWFAMIDAALNDPQ